MLVEIIFAELFMKIIYERVVILSEIQIIISAMERQISLWTTNKIIIILRSTLLAKNSIYIQWARMKYRETLWNRRFKMIHNKIISPLILYPNNLKIKVCNNKKKRNLLRSLTENTHPHLSTVMKIIRTHTLQIIMRRTLFTQLNCYHILGQLNWTSKRDVKIYKALIKRLTILSLKIQIL